VALTMNVREHDLAQPAAADVPAITGPATPPRRDFVEDADSSFTRKRPRLDTGSNSMRAHSSDPPPSAKAPPSPREQRVEMTIRSHPPSSPVTAAHEQGHTANDFSADLDMQNLSPILIATTEDESGSPPVMLIDEDGDAPASFPVQTDAEAYFQAFPYGHLGNYLQVTRDLPQYIHGSTLCALLLFTSLS
jgi:ubiquitin carboxyl-terminal hydrolase 34